MSPILLEEGYEHHQIIASTTKILTPLKVQSKGRPTSKRKKLKAKEIIIRTKLIKCTYILHNSDFVI